MPEEFPMRAVRESETKTVRGVLFRSDPAREPCFKVVHLHQHMEDYGDMSDVSRRQRLHHMHNEMQSLEIAAQCIVDFPDAPWELRMELARQCWDETRHTQALYRRLLEIGGHKGEFPVMNYEWGVTCMMDSLVARLALQNRTFEGGEMDLLRELAEMWRKADDEQTAELLGAILVDEIHHVRFANQWLKRLAREDPRTLLKVAQAMQRLRTITAALAPGPSDVNAAGVPLTGYTHNGVLANIEDRRRAEFTEAEIAQILRQEGFAGLVSQTQTASA
jgi:bacterioferritin (cytochrome b1)